MQALLRLSFGTLGKPQALHVRSISLFPSLRLKESSMQYRLLWSSGKSRKWKVSRQLNLLHEVQEGKELIIKGVLTPSGREPYLLKSRCATACAVCNSGLDIKHTDVLILSQFVRLDGCMLPRRITGLCRQQQKRMSALVTMAQKAGLMPNLNPATSKNDPKKRAGWKKYNKYFDESTIKLR